MSTILDHHGNPATSTRKLIHASDTSRYRGPQFLTQNKSLEDLISERDRDVIVSLSKRLFFNFGPMQAVVSQKQTYSVGEAWLPTYEGPDKEEGLVVTTWLRDVFYHSLDVRGGQWDWWENLESVSGEADVSGDHFTLKTTTKDGLHPRIKNIPSYAVRTKGADHMTGKVKGGEWDGRKITHGIIYDDDEKAVAYRVSTGSGQADFKDVPAASMIHTFDPSLSDGKRGLPTASAALEDLKHILQSTEYERTRQLILSSIGLFVENETGGPNMGDPRNELRGDATSTTSGIATQEISPQIWYAQAGKGQKITQLKNEAGGDTFESFQDRMIRSYVKAANWSYSLAWKPTGQGTAERGEILIARKSILARQKRLRKWAINVITYAYAFEQKKGNLPLLEKPFSWAFSKPPRLSVDDGREAKMMEQGYRLGRYNMTELVEADGGTIDAHYRARAEEAAKRQRIIKEYKDDGIDIDERELVMFTANEQASTDTEESTTPPNEPNQ